MAIQSPYSFLSAHLDSDQCELAVAENGNINVFVPTREKPEAWMELGTRSFVIATLFCQEAGLKVTWE